ncbi:ABC transporter ATP-binding protein [Dendrosporobacter sp. 1207_IL3150]|uniref:ABC transporter ATP-binding protein n=1 Tax=Dendrosporobacter sp. 1207_IL3150 TaxID=3084054 RepID=UPI002FDB49F7
MNQQLLDVNNLKVVLGSKTILQDVSFSANVGEFIGIIGPNAAGKSTLLRCLRGLLPPADGMIRLYGQNIAGLKDKQLALQVAYMQQELNIGFGYTGLELVLAGRYPHLKWWQNERQQDIEIALEFMKFTGVSDLADTPVECVSGGQRQRILLAKVLAQQTQLVFLDEPTASLDLVYQEEMFRYCQNMCSQGKTMLIVAHDLKLAAKFCSRLILIAGGSIVADGVPSKVITEENLKTAYGMQAAVFTNKVTGALDLHTYAAHDSVCSQRKVHVIGGGGTAGAVLRLLYERGCNITCGVLAEGDADAEAAKAFKIPGIFIPPFSVIAEESAEQHREQIAQADLTILTNVCFGDLNLDNLRAAFKAKKLIILEDTPIEQRDYSGGKATNLYRELVKKANTTVITSEQLAAQLPLR